MRKIMMGLLFGMCITCLACSGRSEIKPKESNSMASVKIVGVQAKLISVCFSDFEQLESKEVVLDMSKFDVLFDESSDMYTVTFVFHSDGSDRAGGRSKWGRDVKYEISKSKFEVVGKKFFK